MSYELHKNRANELILKSKSIGNLNDRLSFIIREKSYFASNNNGYYVPMIISIYDCAIDETKFLLQQRQTEAMSDKAKNMVAKVWKEVFGEARPDHLMNVIATIYESAKNETEQDYQTTFESVKYWLMKEGRVLPKDFQEFWGWYVLNYGDEIDETGIIKVTREHILKFCNEIEYKLTKPDAPKPETETTEQKIKRLLEPLRGAFDSPGHIDIIIDAFIKLKAGENLPKVNKAILYNMEPKEFIKPFGRLFADGMFKRGDITKTLLFYIKKNTIEGDPEFAEGYINRLLSECQSK